MFFAQLFAQGHGLRRLPSISCEETKEDSTGYKTPQYCKKKEKKRATLYKHDRLDQTNNASKRQENLQMDKHAINNTIQT